MQHTKTTQSYRNNKAAIERERERERLVGEREINIVITEKSYDEFDLVRETRITEIVAS